MIELLTTPQSLAGIATAIAVFATILTVVMPMLAKDPLEGRMKSVALEREKLRARERSRLMNEKKENRTKVTKKEPWRMRRQKPCLFKLGIEGNHHSLYSWHFGLGSHFFSWD